MQLEYDPEAENDFNEALAWYVKQSVRAADQFESAVRKAFEKIKTHPEQFPLTHGGCRRCSLRPFPLSVIFLPCDDVIVIIAVAHSSRDETFWHHRV